jgi:hypothetical protein
LHAILEESNNITSFLFKTTTHTPPIHSLHKTTFSTSKSYNPNFLTLLPSLSNPFKLPHNFFPFLIRFTQPVFTMSSNTNTNTNIATNEHDTNPITNNQTTLPQSHDAITNTVPLNVDPIMTVFPEDPAHATPLKYASKKKSKAKSSKSEAKSSKKTPKGVNQKCLSPWRIYI